MLLQINVIHEKQNHLQNEIDNWIHSLTNTWKHFRKYKRKKCRINFTSELITVVNR